MPSVLLLIVVIGAAAWIGAYLQPLCGVSG
jgi:hypothetical protein